MIQTDGTENKSNFGANAILGVSMAIARAAATDANLELYEYLANAYNLQLTTYNLPHPLAVFIEGGRHADNSTDLQEYILAVTKNQSAKANVQMMEEIYQATETLLKQQGFNTNVGNEGAFAPAGITSNELPLQILTEAIEQAGYQAITDAGIYIDAAASEFLSDNKYSLKVDKKLLTSDEIIAMYADWFHKYPIVALEDGLSEFDWSNWPKLMSQAGTVKIVADDLTVTNAKLWQKAIDEKCANAILIKLNQAGTVSETVEACLLAKKYNLTTIPSHRGGGETNDTFLVDLAVAMGSEWIKVGPTRGERVCKYNRLMRIEEMLIK
jgi:enolase